MGGKNPPKPPRHCQCSRECLEIPLKNSPFCHKHRFSCPRKVRLSGWEPDYNPKVYNSDDAIQHSHNCYAYALRYLDLEKIKECRKTGNCVFHVSGKKKGHRDYEGKLGKTCSDIVGRTKADIPRGYLTTFDQRCKQGTSKIFMLVDQNRDLHYGSQDSNGYFSHKPGSTKTTDLDSEGVRIYRPDLASWHYPKAMGDNGLFYTFCSYMCIPRDGSIRITSGGNTNKAV